MGPITVQYSAHVICPDQSQRVWHGGDLLPHDAHHLVHLRLLLGHPLASQDLLHLLDGRPLGLLDVRGRENGLRVTHAQVRWWTNHSAEFRSRDLPRPIRGQRWRESNVFKWGVEVKSRLPLSCNRGWRWLLKSTCFPRPGGTIYNTGTVNEIRPEEEVKH